MNKSFYIAATYGNVPVCILKVSHSSITTISYDILKKNHISDYGISIKKAEKLVDRYNDYFNGKIKNLMNIRIITFNQLQEELK